MEGNPPTKNAAGKTRLARKRATRRHGDHALQRTNRKGAKPQTRSR